MTKKLAAEFQRSLLRIDGALAARNARLLPGGMHATMDPRREFRRWPHDYAEVYGAYERLLEDPRFADGPAVISGTSAGGCHGRSQIAAFSP